jgi:hypothetical protein
MEGLIGLWSIWKAIGMQKQPFGLGQPDRDPAKAPVDPRNVTPVTARSRKTGQKTAVDLKGMFLSCHQLAYAFLFGPATRSRADQRSTKNRERQPSLPTVSDPADDGLRRRLRFRKVLESFPGWRALKISRPNLLRTN